MTQDTPVEKAKENETENRLKHCWIWVHMKQLTNLICRNKPPIIENQYIRILRTWNNGTDLERL